MDPKIGLKIKNKRRECNMTLKELAGDMVTAAQISAVENGKCKPSKGLLEYISKRLNSNVDYFVLTEEEIKRRNFESVQKECQPLIDNKNYEKATEIINNYKNDVSYLSNEQKGFFYYICGNAFMNKKLYNDAFDNFVKSEVYYLQTSNYSDISKVYIDTGNCLFKSGKINAALGYYFNSINYSEKCSNVCNILRAKYDVCISFMTLKKYAQAEQYIDDCLKTIDESKYEHAEVFLPGLKLMQGNISLCLKKNDKCLEQFKDVFKKYKENNNFMGMGKSANNYAICMWNKGQIETAEEYFKKAIDYKKHCTDETIIDSFINLAEIYKDNGKIDECLEVLEDAEENIAKINNTNSIIGIFEMKFECYLEMKNYEKAEIAALVALNYIQKINDKNAAAKLYVRMSEMYKNIGDGKSCIEYALKAKKQIG